MSLLCTAIVSSIVQAASGDPEVEWTGDVQFLNGCPASVPVLCLSINLKERGVDEWVQWYARCIDKNDKLVYVGFIERTTST